MVGLIGQKIVLIRNINIVRVKQREGDVPTVANADMEKECDLTFVKVCLEAESELMVITVDLNTMTMAAKRIQEVKRYTLISILATKL